MTLLEYMQAHGGWGELPPIVVDEQGNIIDGIRRAKAAKAYGLKDVPSRVVQGVGSDQQRMDLRLLLNDKEPWLLDELDAWLDAYTEAP